MIINKVMGTYTNIIFEKENISINAKNLYPEDVIENFNKHGKIFYTLNKDEYNADVYYIFGNEEWDGYNAGIDIYDDSSYNFKYNSKTNCLMYCQIDNFYAYLVDTTKYNSFEDVQNAQNKISCPKYWYKNLNITNVLNAFDDIKTITFKQDDIYYNICFKVCNLPVVESFFCYTDDGDGLLFDTRDVKARIVRYLASACINIKSDVKLQNVIQYFQEFLNLDNTTTNNLNQDVVKLIEIYKNQIEPNIPVLLELLEKYNRNTRIEILNDSK